MIRITYVGPTGSDCTGPISVDISKPMTLGEFIDEWLNGWRREWGTFAIKTKEKSFVLANPRWEYRYGELMSDISEKWRNRKIKSVIGHGGWSLVDLLFELEEEENGLGDI